MTTTETIDWAKAEHAKGDRSLSVTIALALKDPREMTEQELEKERDRNDAIYHSMKEDEGRYQYND